MHALDVNTTPITTFTNHKSQNGKIKVYIQMRQQQQQQQWEGKEKTNSSHELRTLLGISTEQDLLFSLSLFLPPHKTEKTMHHHNSYRLLFPSQIQVHTDIHTYPFLKSASEWCVCVCIHCVLLLLPSINSSRPIITYSHSIDDINFLSEAHKARMFPPFLLLLTRALLLLLSPPLIFRFRFSFRICESAMAFVARD